MKRMRAAAGLLASVALAAAAAGPVAAEPWPATLSIETAVVHYLGGWWQQEVPFSVNCDGFPEQVVWVDLPGYSGDVLAGLGPVLEGTHCWLQVDSYPNPGEGADWEPEGYTPSDDFVLQPGENVVTMTIPRVWAMEWPPEPDSGFEYDMALTVDRVYLNGKGGIEVEGTSWCPDAEALPHGGVDFLFAGVNWQALQYVGRKTALSAGYASGIAHPCWDAGEPDHGPYAWQTRYPYPDGGLMFVYSPSGKFGSNSIHIEAFSDTSARLVVQNFAPGGWTSYEGEYVPYDEFCEDNDGDGWCVTEHFWFGFAQADLKPIKVR